MSFPLDGGFLRRECPNCERQFKWYQDSTAGLLQETSDPPIYYCPYCGETALSGDWWTQEQIEYVEQSTVYAAITDVRHGFKRSMARTRSSLSNVSTRSDDPEPPCSLIEPDDMREVQPPCHPMEPTMIDDSWIDALHRLICGQKFAMD